MPIRAAKLRTYFQLTMPLRREKRFKGTKQDAKVRYLRIFNYFNPILGHFEVWNNLENHGFLLQKETVQFTLNGEMGPVGGT